VCTNASYSYICTVIFLPVKEEVDSFNIFHERY
jgi:hypothetical protein